MSKALTALLLFLPAFSYAAELHVSGFGGVNNYADPMFIADNDASDARNVITYEGDLRPVPGSTLQSTVASSSITFLGEYVNPDGRRVLFAKSGLGLYASNPNTGVMTLIKTFDSEREIDGAPAFGAMYFVDGSEAWWSDGVSTYTATNMSACDYVDFYANRLVCVSISTETSRMNLSAYNSSTTWTTGSGDDDAAVKYFAKDDGYQINCVKATPYGIFVGKDRSSHILKGDSNNTFYQFPLSDTIGCSDDRSVQFVDGAIMWLGNEGNIYGWGGEGRVVPMSEEVKGWTRDIRKSQSQDNSWTVASKTGWEAGTYAGWETVVSPGVLKSATYANTAIELTPAGFLGEGGESVTNDFWVQLGTAGLLRSAEYARYGSYSYYNSPTDQLFDVLEVREATSDVLLASGTANYSGSTLQSTLINLGTFPGQSIKLKLRSKLTDFTDYALSVAYPGEKGACLYFHNANPTNNNSVYVDRAEFVAGSTITSTAYDTGLTAPEYQAIVTSGTGITELFYTSADSGTWTSALTFPLDSSEKLRYWKYAVVFGATQPDYYYSYVTAISTADYLSPVTFTSADISSWLTFVGAYTATGTTPIFSVRSGTYSFTADGATPAWTVQSNGGAITISTGTYVQYKINPNIDVASKSVTMASTSLGYLVGSVAPRVASLTYDGHYLLSVSTNSATANHLTLMYQKNKKWTALEGQSYGAMSVYNNKPIAGDGQNSSEIWYLLQDGVKSYNGTAIDSWWQTKDYTLGSVNNHKVINRMWVNAEGNGVNELDISWQADRNGTWYSTSTALSGTSFVIREVDGLFETYNLARQARFKFAADEIDKDFRLKIFSLYYDVNPLIQ